MPWDERAFFRAVAESIEDGVAVGKPAYDPVRAEIYGVAETAVAAEIPALRDAVMLAHVKAVPSEATIERLRERASAILERMATAGGPANLDPLPNRSLGYRTNVRPEPRLPAPAPRTKWWRMAWAWCRGVFWRLDCRARRRVSVRKSDGPFVGLRRWAAWEYGDSIVPRACSVCGATTEPCDAWLHS